MTVSIFLPDLWATLGGVAHLQGSAFVRAASMSRETLLVGLAIVLFAGFSEAVAQSIVLFANRVKPARFFFSWAIGAFLFLFGYVFLVLSTWAVCRLPGTPHLPLYELALVFALSYVPLFFSFAGALPYIGPGILTLLRVWHLLAMVVGLSAVAGVGFFASATYVALGWTVMVLAQRSFGKPIAMLGSRLIDAVAGVKIVDDEQLIIGRAQAGGDRGYRDAAPPRVAIAKRPVVHPNAWKAVLGLAGVALLVLVLSIALDPLRSAMFGWQEHLPEVAQLPIDFLWLAILAVIVSAFMAPLETLGWWAGWYGDRIDTSGEAATSDGVRDRSIGRYVIYLDGIAQSSSRYTPDIETFLDALAPELPGNVCLIRGVMSYSVMNRPLEDDPLFSRLWKFVDAIRFKKAQALIGMIINIRNVFIVAVSADPRYGPIYNFGIALVMYKSLLANGYKVRSGVPVTLIGYSGGGQMSCAAAHFLKRALDAPVDVISLGGVISGDDPVLDLEHLHHLVGDRDDVERIGPVMFPSRWKIAVLSNWNRAKRLGRLTQISLGPVGHQVPGGMLDPDAKLPDGRTNLRQTLDLIENILTGKLLAVDPGLTKKPSNYEKYISAPWNRPEYYPLDRVPAKGYLPSAPWIGRLILPERENRFGGALFEVQHAPPDRTALVGTIVKLAWNEDDPGVRDMLRAVRRDVSFSAEADFTSTYGGFIHPVRIDRWRLVDPLESLAASHPIDDVVVRLPGNVVVEDAGAETTIRIDRQPVQITGRYYGLVTFLGPAQNDEYRVKHFDKATKTFRGSEEVVRLPPVVDDLDGRAPSRVDGIESSPLNDEGWYVYGAPDSDGRFVVQSLAPRALLRPVPRETFDAGPHAAYGYVRRGAWRELKDRRGGIVNARGPSDWNAGDTGLLIHTYGGIGGVKRESNASGPVYFGHFAYGIAEIVDDPLSGEPRFAITYYQLYTNNPDGIIAGALDWSRYLGDRQFGWAGLRPVCDVILKDEDFSQGFAIDGSSRAGALDALLRQLDVMTARYRIGDGTGGTYVGAANNCSQDSNRALFATLRSLRRFVEKHPAFKTWARRSPEEYDRYVRLRRLTRRLRGKLQPFGAPRRDWSENEYNLGATIEDAPIQNVVSALGSWRCILPRLACQTIAGTFIADGAAVWVLGTSQIGAPRADVEPIVPMTL